MHLKNESEALREMRDLGVLFHSIGNDGYEKDQRVLFDGYEVAEIGAGINSKNYKSSDGGFTWDGDDDDDDNQSSPQEQQQYDTRVFFPLSVTGNLIYASPERILATTPSPLPEGLCGGPVINENNGKVTGVVEGIVPKDHSDERVAGAAAFLPAARLKEFIESAELYILQELAPKELFNKAMQIKLGLKNETSDIDISNADAISAQTQSMIQDLLKNHSPDEVDKLMKQLEEDKQKLKEYMENQGGGEVSLEEAINQVTGSGGNDSNESPQEKTKR